MTQRARFFGVALAGLLGGAVACGGDGTGPGPTAASVTGIAGDNQSAPTGTTLTFPLSFIALNSSGQPAAGVRVTWSVSPSGAASFSPSLDTSDANGAVSTTVTATTFIGNITITAAVPGVAAGVVYHATVLDPCAFFAPYTVGDTVQGALRSTDCNLNNHGWFYDFFGLTLPAGEQSIRISMHANFPGPTQQPADSDDTYIVFWSAAGPPVAFDDDSVLGQDGARNSQLDIVLPGGDYVIGANSFAPFITGPYSLTAANRAVAMNGCREVWVMRGVTVSDSVTRSDCADSTGTPHYYDVARIIAFAGSVLQIAERSTTINPSLALYRMRINQQGAYVRTLVASNDDSAGTANTNAFLRFAVDTSDVYDVIIGTSASGEIGAYTFSVDTTTTLSPRRSPASAPREWWRVAPGELLLQSRRPRSKTL
jgi:hypothetical protein